MVKQKSPVKNSKLSSKENSGIPTGRRPRRNAQTKLVGDSVGMSRKEEKELNKALYASLNVTRSNSNSSASSSSGGKRSGRGNTKRRSSNSVKGSLTSKSQKVAQSKKESFHTADLPVKHSRRCSDPEQVNISSPAHSSTPMPSPAASWMDESSQDSVRSSDSHVGGTKSYFDRKVHAQRKFAQNYPLPKARVSQVSSLPAVKSAIPSVKMLSSKIPKTEDFLTFLCLRGKRCDSSVLPPHLDLFEDSCDELPTTEVGSGSFVERQMKDTSNSLSAGVGAGENEAEAANVPASLSGGQDGNSISQVSAAQPSTDVPVTVCGIVDLLHNMQNQVLYEYMFVFLHT